MTTGELIQRLTELDPELDAPVLIDDWELGLTDLAYVAAAPDFIVTGKRKQIVLRAK